MPVFRTAIGATQLQFEVESSAIESSSRAMVARTSVARSVGVHVLSALDRLRCGMHVAQCTDGTRPTPQKPRRSPAERILCGVVYAHDGPAGAVEEEPHIGLEVPAELQEREELGPEKAVTC